MDYEQIIEDLTKKLFKAENDLKVKLATESHLIWDNENLLEENEKLTQELTQSKETTEKMDTRIKKLEGDVVEIESLKDENETLINEINILKDNLNRQLKTIKELSKPTTNITNSPDIKMRDTIIKYKSKINDLNETNAVLTKKVEHQSYEINQLKDNIKKEIEIFTSKIENYKELLETAKQEKEEIENEFMMFQTDANQPDFKRQGNSLYNEVNDRRVLVELKLQDFQDELLRLRNVNKSLRSFLEGVFEEFSILKEEETLHARNNLRNEISDLKSDNKRLETDFRQMHTFFSEHIEKSCQPFMGESMTVRGMYLENARLEKNLKSLTDVVVKHDTAVKEMNQRNDKLYKTNLRLYQENASLLTKIADFESKLACWDSIVPEDKKKEYEEKQKQNEELMAKVAEEDPMSTLPAGVFGPLYINAQYKDHLVFDVYGKPISNRLTRKVLFKDRVDKPEITVTAPVTVEKEVTLLSDIIKSEQIQKEMKDKENVDPVDIVEQTPDCAVN